MSQQASIPSAIPSSSSSADFFLVARQDLDLYWGFIAGFLEDKKGGINSVYKLPELYAELRHNPNSFVWLGLDRGLLEAVLVLNFAHDADRTTCWITGTNSIKASKYIPILEKIEHWAFMLGANEMAFEGRKGWLRLMQKHGYRTPTVIMRKSLARSYGH